MTTMEADGAPPSSPPDTIAAGPQPKTKPRRGWVAFVLSLLTPGLGQLYAGDPGRAVFFYALRVLLALGGVAILSRHGITPWNVLGYWLYAIAAMLVSPVDAVFAARRQRPAYQLRRFNRWYVYLGCVVFVSVVSATVVKGMTELGKVCAQICRMPSSSMEDTLLIGDQLVVDNLAYGVRLPGRETESWHLADPGRGDLVTFRRPEYRSKLSVKRVIGLPGEKVEIRGPVVYVNGQPLAEPYAKHTRPRTASADLKLLQGDVVEDWGPETVPAGRYFILGDNRDNSLDSRSFGFVPRADILGRVRSIYWSVEMSRADYSRDGSALWRPVRWRRIGLPVR
jgi:signal peptidase I